MAPMGTCTSAELGAAVSNEGGLGGIGSLFRPAGTVKRDIDGPDNTEQGTIAGAGFGGIVY
jgi:hypothetical protein